jgi:iron-sulfur cluster assembly protein
MITLTPLAAEKVRYHLDRRGRGLGIRLGVKTTGCSGLAYVLEFADEIRDEDEQYDSHNVRIFVDPKSVVYIKDTVVDWKKQGLNEGFEFINPAEKDRCGCGESFRV